MKINPDTLEVIALMLGVAFLAAVGRELGNTDPRTVRQMIGHTISNTMIGLAAGGLCLFFSEPHPLALAAISAVIGTLGTDTAILLARKYLESRIK